MYYTYVLHSAKDNELYIGTTSNLRKRYQQHLNGEVFSTKGRLPLSLIFYEELKSKGVRFLAKPFKDPTFDKYFATFYDLDDNLVQLIGNK